MAWCRDEVFIFNVRDVAYCHNNEGDDVGGAGDILFERNTQYYSNQGCPAAHGVTHGLGPCSHGRNMFGRGAGHNATRDLSQNTPMRSSPAVIKAARRCVDFVEEYPDIMDWIKMHQIDMFLSVMIGVTPDLSNPKTSHPLKQLPEDEEHAFVSGFILSVFIKWPWLLKSLDKQYEKAMDNMTSAGVNELRDKFLKLPPEQRPDCFFRSLLETEGVTEKDAEQLMALFIVAFQGNASLTLHNALFHISNHPEVQQKLYEECMEASKLDDPTSHPMEYLRAIFKESHRLTPITPLTQVRLYSHDLVLPSGYVVPAGTRVTMLNKFSTRDPELVARCDEFVPTRFLEEADGKGDKNLNGFLQSSEFGSSLRSCLGRRTVTVMLKAIVVELFTRYRLEASPAKKSFEFDPRDPAFNRIKDYPKIVLHPREHKADGADAYPVG